jgi:hypothetical protein
MSAYRLYIGRQSVELKDEEHECAIQRGKKIASLAGDCTIKGPAKERDWMFRQDLQLAHLS